MKSIIKRSVIVSVVALVVIQFFHPAKNENGVMTDKDITRAYHVPDDVRKVLRRACYDCHSNSTVYPWYSKIQPVDWWLNDHVKEGKRHLNFSEFDTYSVKRKAKKLTEVAGTITDNEMPLSSYTVVHKDAILTDAEKTLVVNWARGLAAQVADTVKKL
ncbi:heme-binding domain-containing protein [Flavipsychrobacter stenotrophus]|uniref:heme-binding domain-containing protein n=1 Tax=Flavipsychrobacter stenotrophus TaxID=2077091 RepID=UPI001F0BBD08|nr:heme-binding domain-containing protein [Flavipsychrobacter stenotrophus]